MTIRGAAGRRRLLLLWVLVWVLSQLQVLIFAHPSMASAGESSPAKPTADGGVYVGSKTCAKCHSQIYKVWQATRHSYSILTGRQRSIYEIDREIDRRKI